MKQKNDSTPAKLASFFTDLADIFIKPVTILIKVIVIIGLFGFLNVIHAFRDAYNDILYFLKHDTLATLAILIPIILWIYKWKRWENIVILSLVLFLCISGMASPFQARLYELNHYFNMNTTCYDADWVRGKKYAVIVNGHKMRALTGYGKLGQDDVCLFTEYNLPIAAKLPMAKNISPSNRREITADTTSRLARDVEVNYEVNFAPYPRAIHFSLPAIIHSSNTPNGGTVLVPGTYKNDKGSIITITLVGNF